VQSTFTALVTGQNEIRSICRVFLALKSQLYVKHLEFQQHFEEDCSQQYLNKWDFFLTNIHQLCKDIQNEHNEDTNADIKYDTDALMNRKI